MSARGLRKVEIGLVTSDRMTKTIAVRVERMVQHPIYGKFLRRHVSFKAHDEKGEAKIGDLVEIMETRPISKTKTWRLVRVIERSRAEFDPKLGLAPAAILGEAGGAQPAS